MNNRTFTLKENDVLYFLHIPKTAGVSFIDFVDNYFDQNSILSHQTWHKLLPHLPLDLNQYNFIRGHYGIGLHRLLNKKSVCITMLREPVERTISSFLHYKREPGEGLEKELEKIEPTSSLQQWKIDDKVSKKILSNNQTKYLSIDLDVQKITNDNNSTYFFNEVSDDFINNKITEKELLENAKNNLMKFAFFGISERFEESLQLLCFTFGWKHNRYIRKMNYAGIKEREKYASKFNLKKITEYNKLDIEIYEFAKKIFEKKYDNMIKFLKEKYYEHKFENMNQNNLVYKLLDIHFENTYFLNISPETKISYSFNQKLFGDGWFSREKDLQTKKYMRWTGPKNKSILYLPMINAEKIKIGFIVKNYLLQNNIDSLKIKINNENVKLSITDQQNKKIFFEGITDIKKLDKFLRISFDIEKTISPESIISNSEDTRMLGILIEKITIEAI